nr:hypothetical protein GCM10010200_013090 [Actinomadura rugatobispora]
MLRAYPSYAATGDPKAHKAILRAGYTAGASPPAWGRRPHRARREWHPHTWPPSRTAFTALPRRTGTVPKDCA